jgi:hypothetical protein
VHNPIASLKNGDKTHFKEQKSLFLLPKTGMIQHLTRNEQGFSQKSAWRMASRQAP